MEHMLTGFGNELSSEALKEALPLGQNSPQKPPYGLYAEQLSGTAFTAPIKENHRTWLYRIRPSVLHKTFEKTTSRLVRTPPTEDTHPTPNQMRWNPLPYPQEKLDFIDSWITFTTNGNANARTGSAIHLFAATASMKDRFFYNSDGDLLIVPQDGRLLLETEMGALEIRPKEIAVIQRGIKFRVTLPDSKARGYICENFGLPFRLPDRGPIGANGLANPRDFIFPFARFEEKSGACELVTKYAGTYWKTQIAHSPLDVVAWHGNYVPYKYDLERFNTMGSISFDHPDPSIFTVLTSPTLQPGTANIDFVIFPRRWMVAENTFRPPYYHRNVMSEFMGLIHGIYDAKETGFSPGGASLHNCMSAHGPETAIFERATKQELKPQLYENTLAFMFESSLMFHPTKYALDTPLLQRDYLECWQGLKSHFSR